MDYVLLSGIIVALGCVMWLGSAIQKLAKVLQMHTEALRFHSKEIRELQYKENQRDS